MIQKTFVLIIAQVVGKLAGFVLLLMLGNMMGAKVLGAYGTLMTLFMIGSIWSTFGVDLWISRWVANHALSARSLWGVLGLRVALALVLCTIFSVLFANQLLLPALGPYRVALALIGVTLLVDQFGFTIMAILEGRRQLVSIAWLLLLRWGVFAGAGAISLYHRSSFDWFCFSFLLGAIFRVLLGWFFLRKELDREAAVVPIKVVFREAAPLAVLNTMVGLYFHIDMVMIPQLDSLQGAGFYKTAYTMVEALLFISGAIASSLYPLFSKNDYEFDVKWEQFGRGSYLMILIAMPITLCTPLVSEKLIHLFFWGSQRSQEFGPVSIVLNLLVWALPAMFLNASLVRLVLGIHRQKLALVGVTLTALFNFTVNLILIPRIGFMGAAWTTVASEILLTIFLWSALALKGMKVTLWHPLVKPVLASFPAWCIAWLCRGFPVLILIPLTILVYGLWLWISRLVTLEDLKKFGRLDTDGLGL